MAKKKRPKLPSRAQIKTSRQKKLKGIPAGSRGGTGTFSENKKFQKR